VGAGVVGAGTEGGGIERAVTEDYFGRKWPAKKGDEEIHTGDLRFLPIT
jgi:hypothetical protein